MTQPGSRRRDKPADSRWTDEQWAAVAAEGTNLLVAAAAGSGKTAVLVERIISRIADESDPLDVDRLLVATFTNAAAAEMKERIRTALEEALERQPESAHLRRQLALLPRASITTLHSFCLDVIERYAPLIGLDPEFRIASDAEAELLRMDTLDQLFEERYEAEGDQGALARLADRFGGERSDEPLHRLVLELYAFARSHPWPEEWLREAAERFRRSDPAALAASSWADSLRADAAQTLDGALGLLRRALELAERPDGPHPYAETLKEDAAEIRRLRAALASDDWKTWHAAFGAMSFGRLKPCKGDGIDPALRERAAALRGEAKKAAARLAQTWFVRTPDDYAAELRALAPDMEALAELVAEFGRRYEQAKRERGLLDFGDMEHYALRILRDPASAAGQSLPSPAALAYRERFEAIMLDEYQDTNEVQEAIVSLITRDRPGNVFMVGDVKQSIYRFRLAEPGLFLHKYRTYRPWNGESQSAGGEAAPEGVKIDLARNFRSRRAVVDAVNRVFRAIMRESVGEMDYDRPAELVYGGGYPEEQAGGDDPYAVEMILLDRGRGAAGRPDAAEDGADGDEAGPEGAAGPQANEGADEAEEAEELETAQLEARCIAAEIRRLTGTDGSGRPPFPVYDARTKLYRPASYRDIVILLRSTAISAPVMLEELKAAGIPAYAELATGYFAAAEVEVMLSLLHVIDNPDQDIPLAGVLRSPLFGLSAEELARVRIVRRGGSFWSAVRAAADSDETDAQLRDKLRRFLERLDRWRSLARREPLGELLLALYRETGYFDFVGGLPGGAQRQANLRALVDRARQYEKNSRFRGLYRFLRFLGRMRETGGDLGAARAIGEQEDVVRIVSIHKSKGLEFPIVFCAGLGRTFNRRDLNGPFLKHKKLGFGPRMVDERTRAAYPTLPQLAIRRRLQAEMLAEEMRILYVALTRPKEKLFLVGTSKDAQRTIERWRETADMSEDGRIPDHRIAGASSFLDWLGPVAVQKDAGWQCRIASAADYAQAASASAARNRPEDAALWSALERLDPVPVAETAAGAEARRALSWTYPYEAASGLAAKTSITAMKRQPGPKAKAAAARSEEEAEEEALEGRLLAPGEAEAAAAATFTYRLRRPRFAASRKLSSAERGTAFHLVLQHLPLRREGVLDAEAVEALLERLVCARILGREQRQAVDAAKIAAFGRSELYRRMCASPQVWRELPFSYGLPAASVYPGQSGAAQDDVVLVQGVIDCLFAEGDGLVLVDYKTDESKGRTWEEAAEAHRFQIVQYAEAVGRILGQPVKEGHVYFLEGGQAVRIL